jgi:glycosyltransferase involved in cell wall biosynthesis
MSKKISIITPCFNAERYIEETVNSVINQTAVLSERVELEYIIYDGLSTDNTVDKVELIKSRCKCNSIKIISECDYGMYDAISKALRLISGEICAYINAGDLYNKYAFDVVLDVFENNKNVNWLTGYNFFYNENSQVIEVTLPFQYRKQFFSCGFYGSSLPHVQQESTFWKSHLNELVDLEYLSKLKYAGDYYLWLQFSKLHNLKIVKSHIGGFKFHRGQLSTSTINNISAYQAEMSGLVNRPKMHQYIVAAFDRILWSAPYRFKKYFNKSGIIAYEEDSKKWI